MAKIANEIILQNILITSTTSSYTTGSRWFYYDSSKYTAPTFYMECEVKVNDGANTASWELYNVTDSSTVSGSEGTSNSTSVVRVVTGPFSLTTAKNYAFRYKTSAGTSTFIYPKIIVIQDSQQLFDIQTMELLSTSMASSTTSTTYSSTGGRFYYDSSKYDGVITLSFEVYLWTTNASGVAYSIVTDVDGNEISGSEVSTSSLTQTRLISGSFSLTNDTVYQVRFKTNNASYTTNWRCPRLLIHQNRPSKIKLPFTIGFGQNTTSATYERNTVTTFGDTRYHDSDNYNLSPTVYCETYLKGNTATRVYADVYDETAGAELSGSEVYQENGTTAIRSYSGPLTMTDNHVYYSRAKSSDGVVQAQLNQSKFYYEYSNLPLVKDVIGNGFIPSAR